MQLNSTLTPIMQLNSTLTPIMQLRVKHIIVGVLILLLVGCATPITRKEARNIQYDCTDVDAKLAELTKERKKNNQRLLNGVQSVSPTGAVIGLLRGRYSENLAIATGEWAKVLDEKIEEMEAFEKECPET